MRPKCPCKDCEKRKFLCHGSCPEYKDFKIKVEEANIARQKERARNNSPERNRKVFRKALKQR